MGRWTMRLATGFGLGYAPVASGTFGALLGLPLAVACAWLPLGPRIAAAALLALLAVPVCDAAEKRFGRKDDGRIVADEYLTFPICTLALPLAALAERSWWQAALMLGIAFGISRVCDIVKPWPARRLQRVRGGLGVVIDDVFASLYALALSHGAWDLLRNVLSGGRPGAAF
jgi:phosphatidylglycerophosphatase A